ncbi:MAG TPA: helix-turn-helix domain-containing protein [Mucilaginibacter sp.]|jgi:DNA-binding XRE family transcriptional regulator
MKKLPRILIITNIEQPYVLYTIWTNGEERKIDLSKKIASGISHGDDRFSSLKEWEVFKQATVSPDNTIVWPNLKQTITLLSGKVITGVLDLDPDTLYQDSCLISKLSTSPKVGQLLKTAREQAGLSQGEVARNSGTTRNYISKIETGKADIQLNTLYRLIKLGIGKDLKLSIH